MHAPESSHHTLASPVTQDVHASHPSPNGLTPLEFAARVYNRVLILTILHVLSIGPMYWQWVESMHMQGHPAVARFYYPLLVVCDLVPIFGELIEWYLSFWV